MKPTIILVVLAVGVGIGLLFAKLFSSDPSNDSSDGDAKRAGGPSSAGNNPADVRKGVQIPAGSQTSPSSGRLTALEPGDEAPVDQATTTDDFREMMARLFSGDATEDEQLKFWEEARTGNHLADIIAELENTVGEDPEEISARMNLAQAYTVKLLGVPSGPEKGIYAGKAEKLWREVLEVDPGHYDAQVSIATSLSRYPAFLNRTADAITEFEKAIEIQEQPGSEIDNPNNYLELSRLQLRDSDPVNALQTLERAAEFHPDNEEISAQLQKLKETYVFEPDGNETGEPVE